MNTETASRLLASDKDFLKPIVRAVLQEVLEQEMTDTLGAAKDERIEGRLGYRSGYYSRNLVTRVGKIELRVPQDRQGRFSTELFERYQRSEKALMAALTKMYIQGVSTRKVKAITENLIGHSFFGLIGISRGQEARWRVSGAAWQRCYVHFLRNAIDHLPRKRDDDCLQELRWLYDRRQLKEAKADIKAWIDKWQGRYPKLVAWVEDNIKETLTYYRLPLAHHRNMKSTNMLERFNEEIKRRTRAVRIFPNEASCLRLVRALAVEQHERSQECAATAMTALSLGRVIA